VLPDEDLAVVEVRRPERVWEEPLAEPDEDPLVVVVVEVAEGFDAFFCKFFSFSLRIWALRRVLRASA
jgi:hypothetical protein